MATIVTFTYEPDEPDDDDSSGMSVDEFDRLMDALAQLGATNVYAEKQA